MSKNIEILVSGNSTWLQVADHNLYPLMERVFATDDNITNVDRFWDAAGKGPIELANGDRIRMAEAKPTPANNVSEYNAAIKKSRSGDNYGYEEGE